MQLHVDRESGGAVQPAALFNNLTARSFPTLSNSIHVDEVPSNLRLNPSQADEPSPEDGDQAFSFNSITVEVHYTVLLVIMVSSVAINGLIFVLFYQRPSVRMTSNKFVLNMAIVHLLQTFLILPFVFVSVMVQEWIFGDIWCKIHGVVSVCLTMANVFSILLIAVDRNCAVNSPLHYSMTITKKRTSGLIVSTWLFAVLVSLPPIIGVSGIKYQESWGMCTVTWYETDLLTIAYSCVLCVVGFLLPFVRITWIYTSMFRAARRNSARARLHNINTSSAEMSPPASAVPEGHLTLHLHRRMAWSKRTSSLSQASSFFGDEWKAVRTGLLVVISFTACFLPFFSMTLIEQHTRTRKATLKKAPAIAMLLLYCSSLISPYLYVIRNKATRKHVRKMFTCLRRKPSFFSPRGYHYSHQSPPQERKFSEETMNVPEGATAIRSSDNPDYHRSMVTHSLYQNKAGDWKIISVKADPRRSPTRRCSAAASMILQPGPLRIDDLALQSSYKHKCGPGLRGAAIRNGFYRRASLDSSKVLSARYSIPMERDIDTNSVTWNSAGDRSMSFRVRGRFANREESTETCDTSCTSSFGQEEWGGHFMEQSHRRNSASRRDSQASASTFVVSDLHQSSGIAQIHNYHGISEVSHPASYCARPSLKRGRSFAFDEQELSTAYPTQRISQSGGLRKSHFAGARNSPRHGSSETTTTTLESSTSTESQDAAIVTSPPVSSPPSLYHYHQHLIHQHESHAPAASIILPFSQSHTAVSQECQDRRDSGFEDTMTERCDICYTIVDETGSIKAVKFIEQ